MSRLSRFVVAIFALTQSVLVATAHDFICLDGACRPPYYADRALHNFHPRLRDGVPMVDDFQHEPDRYHGVACIWSWRRVATPGGPAWGLAPDCHSY